LNLLEIIETVLASELLKLPEAQKAAGDVQNTVLSQTYRSIEICMGILANISSHEELAEPLSGEYLGQHLSFISVSLSLSHTHTHTHTPLEGASSLTRLLLEEVLFLSDPPCLSELFRLLSTAMRGKASDTFYTRCTEGFINVDLICLPCSGI
jgi:hypothetical protein